MKRTRGQGRELFRIEWPTIGLIAGCYGIWFAAGVWLWPLSPLLALAIMAVTVAFHSSLMHEALHGHPTRNALVNEALVALPISLVWPYRRFKSLHLRHHHDERLTDPFDDPESFYKARWRYERMPRIVRKVLLLNNLLIVRIFLGPILGVAALVWSDLQSIVAGDRKVCRAWLIHLCCAVPVCWMVISLFEIPIWLYLAVPVWAGHGIIAIRTFAEHQWNEMPDGRTVIVERSLLSFLFLNNNLHLVHHAHPNIAWYQLPAAYWANRNGWLEMNAGYAYPNYSALFKEFAFNAKEPVVHPEWGRDIEPSFIFLPKGHGQVTMQDANIGAVAKPQRD